MKNIFKLGIIILAVGLPWVLHAQPYTYTWSTAPQPTPYTVTGPASSVNNTTQTVSNDAPQNALSQNATSITGAANPVTTPSTYTLYPGFAAVLKGFSSAGSMGDFINAIIALVTGIGGILAILMIMYEGYSYMVSRRDGKVVEMQNTRENIVKIVMGFLLLLCIYTLLRTINPDLLNLIPISSLTTDQKLALDFSGINAGNSSNTVTKNQINQSATQYAIDKAYIASTYVPARDQISGLATGMKLLITAHATMEGFAPTPSPGTVSWVTNNPGNIGNYGSGGVSRICSPGIQAPEPHTSGSVHWVCYPTLVQGIQKQVDFETQVASGTVAPYVIGGSNGYDGSLGEYLNLYEGGTTASNANGARYLDFFINYFSKAGDSISGQTPVSQIISMQ